MQIYLRWPYVNCPAGKTTCGTPAKFSTGNDCLRFPQETGRNSPALAGNLREALIVRVRVNVFKPKDIFHYPTPNKFTKVTSCYRFTLYVPPEYFIRHCSHHFLKFSYWRSLIELGATKKQLFRRSTCSVFGFSDLSHLLHARRRD